MQSNTRKS